MADMLTPPNTTLLQDIDAFLAETELSATYLGKRAVGNSELVARLRSGGRIWPETEEKLRDFMGKYREMKQAAREGTGEAA